MPIFVQLRDACRCIIAEPSNLAGLCHLRNLVADGLNQKECRTYLDLVLLPVLRCVRQSSDILSPTALVELLLLLSCLLQRQLPLSDHERRPPVSQIVLILSELSSLIQHCQLVIATDENLRRPMLAAISGAANLCSVSDIPSLLTKDQLPLFAHLVTFILDAGITVDPGDTNDRCAGAICLTSLLKLQLSDIGFDNNNDSDCSTLEIDATDVKGIKLGKSAVSAFLRPLLPGLVSKLGSVLSGSIRLNSRSRCAILRVMRRVLTMGLISNETFTADTARRVDAWLESALRPDIEANWTVRLEICYFCGRLLHNVLPILPSADAADVIRPRLLNRLLRLCADQQPKVSSIALEILGDDSETIRIDKAALELCESLERLASGCHGNRDELLACLNGLAGCSNVRPSSGRLCLRSVLHRDCLIRGLAFCIAPDASRLSLVEEADPEPDDDVDNDDGVDADVAGAVRLLLTRMSSSSSDDDTGDLLADATLDCLSSMTSISTSERRLRLGCLALLVAIAARCKKIEATKQRLLECALSVLDSTEVEPSSMSMALVAVSKASANAATARERRESATARRLALRLVGRLGRHFPNDQTLPMNCLYPCLAACAHPLTAVRAAALKCLSQLAQSISDSTSIGSLIGANADYIFNQCLVKLLGPPSHEPFAVLHSALAHCNADVLPALEPLVLRLCDRVDKHYEQLHRMLVPLLAFLLRSLCRVLNIDVEGHMFTNALTMPTSGEVNGNDSRDRILKADRAAKELLIIWRRRRGYEYPSSAGDDKPSVVEDDEPRAQKPPPPVHARLCQQVVDRLVHLTHFEDEPSVRRAALAGLTYAAYAMSHDDGPSQERLLPTIHSLWPATVRRLADPDHSVSLEAVNTVLAVANLSGDFLRSRIADDVIRPLCRTMLPAALARAPSWQPAVFRRCQEFRRLRCILQSLGPLAVRSRLQLMSLDLLVNSGLAPFLSKKLPEELRLAALESMRCIYAVEPSLVWHQLYLLCPRVVELSPTTPASSASASALSFIPSQRLLELRSQKAVSDRGDEYWPSIVAILNCQLD